MWEQMEGSLLSCKETISLTALPEQSHAVASRRDCFKRPVYLSSSSEQLSSLAGSLQVMMQTLVSVNERQRASSVPSAKYSLCLPSVIISWFFAAQQNYVDNLQFLASAGHSSINQKQSGRRQMQVFAIRKGPHSFSLALLGSFVHKASRSR